MGERPAERVTHDDRRTVQALDHLAEMVERFGDGCFGDDLRLFPQRLDLDLEARVRRHDHLMALRPVVLHPAVPAPGGHPKPMDQHDRRGIGRRLASDDTGVLAAVCGGDRRQLLRRLISLGRPQPSGSLSFAGAVRERSHAGLFPILALPPLEGV